VSRIRSAFSDFHNHIVELIAEGDKVEFEVVQGQKGPQAADVTKVS